MKPSSCLVLLTVAAIGATGWIARPKRVETIRPDSAAIESRVVEPQLAQGEPGAGPRLPEWIARPRHVPPEPKPKIDTVEPWNGKDLGPELELAKRDGPHMKIDRVDPWTPGIMYPEMPGPNPELDEEPWVANGVTSVPHRVAKAAPAKASKLLEPWPAEITSERSAKTLAYATDDAPASPNLTPSP
jgi:hypothetical protein